MLEFYVGRSDELSRLTKSTASVIYITGIGEEQENLRWQLTILRKSRPRELLITMYGATVKKKANVLERQLVSIVAVLGGNRVSEYELATQPIKSVTELFVELVKDIKNTNYIR